MKYMTVKEIDELLEQMSKNINVDNDKKNNWWFVRRIMSVWKDKQRYTLLFKRTKYNKRILKII